MLRRTPTGPSTTTVMVGMTATLGVTALLGASVLWGDPGLRAAPATTGAPARHPLTSTDFIKANGTVLRTDSGAGAAINLRGTNLGGWLVQEDWMSPLGEFALDRGGWTVTASTGSHASATVDGEQATHWSTSGPQRAGDQIRVDLRQPTWVNRVTLGTDRVGEHPRRLAVETSSDGQTWTNVAQQGGTDQETVVRFGLQKTRFLRLVAVDLDAAPWSISELNLFNDPVAHDAGWTAQASATATGTTPAAAVDGDPTTAWQSGVPQAPGQALTIDMQRVIQMDRLLLDAGSAAPDDFARSWEILTSTDNVTFEHAASGFGSGRTTLVDFQGWKWGRYLRIVNHATAPQWWSVADVAVYTGNQMDRAGWQISASEGQAPERVIDGDVGTRWSTGSPQRDGQHITVDLGALTTLNSVALEAAENMPDEGDWPRGYRVETSRDGATWTTAASGQGTFRATSIAFPARATRYLRVVQTGTAAQWWSIGELTAGLYSDDYALHDTLTQRLGTDAAQRVLDTHQATWITEADLDTIAGLGLTFVRVPMGWTTFVNPDGSWKAQPFDRLDWIVREAGERGLYVLLDLHTVPGGGCPWASCGKVGPSPNGFWGSSDAQQLSVDIWTAVAARYRGNPAVAGYDLINEPLIDMSEDADDVRQKNDLFDRLYDAVRAVDPDHVVVLPAFFDLNAIAHPREYGWTNVMYQFHPYDMSAPKDWAAQERLVANELDAIPDRHAAVGVPLLKGEFSLYHNDDLWARFLAGMNAQGVSWSNWAYKVKGSAESGFAYWGLHHGNAHPVPVHNSDSEATMKAKLRAFGTENFTANAAFHRTVARYATGRASYAPVEIPHSGWRVTASSSPAGLEPERGIDGSNDEGWYTGADMAGGEWFQIDMGTVHPVAMVTLQTPRRSPRDYPRGFDIEVSTDGISWQRVARSVAFGWKRPIAIEPTTARYLRITQTGAAPQWWSIDDVAVYASY
ncbi:discoidin domain-containing protein [Propioniciclava soli]|uniref:Exo-1,3-beta-glucanase D n=1 Tax=Propioniciclava soli TaxID=2775081 RepID=A0ABZ3C9D8_9ACTN